MGALGNWQGAACVREMDRLALLLAKTAIAQSRLAGWLDRTRRLSFEAQAVEGAEREFHLEETRRRRWEMSSNLKPVKQPTITEPSIFNVILVEL